MEEGMRHIFLLGLAAQMALSALASAQSAQASASQQPALMDRQREIALALSACPPFVAGKTAVYVLEKSGYVRVRDSQNGFTALVQHTVPAAQEHGTCVAHGHSRRIARVPQLVSWPAGTRKGCLSWGKASSDGGRACH